MWDTVIHFALTRGDEEEKGQRINLNFGTSSQKRLHQSRFGLTWFVGWLDVTSQDNSESETLVNVKALRKMSQRLSQNKTTAAVLLFEDPDPHLKVC